MNHQHKIIQFYFINTMFIDQNLYLVNLKSKTQYQNNILRISNHLNCGIQ